MITITLDLIEKEKYLAKDKLERLIKHYVEAVYYKMNVDEERERVFLMMLYYKQLLDWSQDFFQENPENINYITKKGLLYLISNIRNV